MGNQRPKKTAKLPSRMLARKRVFVSGKVWIGYYYNSRDENGKRVEIPLGKDLNEAKRKWAELDGTSPPAEIDTMQYIFDRYVKDVIPKKAIKTQYTNLLELKHLRRIFDSAPINKITPQHIAQYRDARFTPERILKDGTKVAKKLSPVSANRELALFSHCWNYAREWGYTALPNPCLGIRKNKELGRSFYADDEVWNAVYTVAPQELQDAMDIAYLTGQRVSDVLKFKIADIVNEHLQLKQGKTQKLLRIALLTESGEKSQLGLKIDQMNSYPVKSLRLLATPDGKSISIGMLRLRFNAARDIAIRNAKKAGHLELAARVAQFQFRDSRSKAASEIEDLDSASRLLGHTDKQITKTVYRRVGERVKPTK